MKRKLIEFDVFERIKKDSLSTAQKEVEEATRYLAKALDLESLDINCFGSEDVLFEANDGTYVHANYKVNNGFVEFDNVEQLMINEESERAKSREVLSEMLDCLIESNEKKAEELFGEWVELPVSKRIFNEVRKKRVVPIRKKGKIVGYRTAYWNVGNVKKRQSSKVKIARSKGKKIAQKKMPEGVRKLRAAQRKRAHATLGHMVKEWHVLAENVLGYVDYCEHGPVVQDSFVKRDDKGNVVSIKIPNSKLRNEAKVLQFNWKTLHTDVVVKRKDSKKMCENINFAKQMAEIKKQNALSDDKAFAESLEKAVTNWPQVLYLTQDELSTQVRKALESVGATNYDDSTCEFIAEGLLRTAHDTYVDRVSKIVKLANGKINKESTDKYVEFKNIVEKYFKNLDESTSLEMQVFVDLYETLREVHELAKEEQNRELAVEAAEYLDELLSIITKESEPSLEVASAAADWLYDLVETNLDSVEWEVSEPVVSVTGEHPVLAQKAKKSYAPSSDFSGDFGDVSPTSDGKEMTGDAADELAHSGASNVGGNDTYPSLNNPYLLKNDEYKIKGEKDVDSDTDQLAHWGSSDTWPNLQNPYCKHAESPKDVE